MLHPHLQQGNGRKYGKPGKRTPFGDEDDMIFCHHGINDNRRSRYLNFI